MPSPPKSARGAGWMDGVVKLSFADDDCGAKLDLLVDGEVSNNHTRAVT